MTNVSIGINMAGRSLCFVFRSLCEPRFSKTQNRRHRYSKAAEMVWQQGDLILMVDEIPLMQCGSR